MKITCPSCEWSAEVPEEQIPANSEKATCPKCKSSFDVKKPEVQSPDFTFETAAPVGIISPMRERVPVSERPEIIAYAGFWRRFAAVIIDSIILSIAGAIAGAIIGFILGIILSLSGTDMLTIQAISGTVGFIIGMVLNWLYFTLLESSSKQATLGKQALGIIVTDLNGSPVSFGTANGRYWGKLVSAITLLIGFIIAGITQKKQALHDIMASTLVVRK